MPKHTKKKLCYEAGNFHKFQAKINVKIRQVLKYQKTLNLIDRQVKDMLSPERYRLLTKPFYICRASILEHFQNFWSTVVSFNSLFKIIHLLFNCYHYYKDVGTALKIFLKSIQILKHGDIQMLFDDDEENCILYLKTFEMKEFEDIDAGYSLNFTFDVNPYFKNDMLVKQYYLRGIFFSLFHCIKVLLLSIIILHSFSFRSLSDVYFCY